MGAFDERWVAAVGGVGPVLERRGATPAQRADLQARLLAAGLPGRLVLLADPAGGGGPTGDRLIDGAVARAAADPRIAASGLDRETIAGVLRALLAGRGVGEAAGGDDAIRAALVEAATRHLAAQGIAVTPDEARTALRLLSSGEFFQDAGASLAVVAHAIPRFPIALGRDVPRVLGLVRVLPAILLDAPDLGLAAARLLRSSLLDGAATETPKVMTRTMRVLYELATIRGVAETLRSLIARDNESVRLALILYARANGVPLTPEHLDALHDRVLDTDDPDLGPVLAAALEHYRDQLDVEQLRTVLGAFETLGARDPERRAAAVVEPEVPTRFEGVVFRMRSPVVESPTAVVERTLGADWRCVPFSPSTPTEFVAQPPRAMTASEGWEATYRVGGDAGVERAEPQFETQVVGADRPTARGLFGSDERDPASAERKWSPRMVRAFEAWQLEPPAGGARFGEGIVVGQPDTGVTAHTELEGRLVPGYDFLEEDADATDPLDGGFLRFPGHGTGTASVLVSADEADAQQLVTGVAPSARVMPLRVSRSVIHLSMGNVTRAIYHAVDHGCHVISMSLGGIGFDYLHDAVRYAVQRGVIVVAAAGNQVRIVVYPAAYDEAIAVAGCTAGRRPWSGSCRGDAVDISAPAEGVWKAEAGGDHRAVGQSDGTSFATASVAGVASLWLAFHGRERLVARYGAPGVPRVFKHVLVTVGYGPGVDWDTGRYGPGIVDACSVLEARLPDAVPVPRAMPAAPAAVEAAHEIARQLPDMARADAMDAVASALGVARSQLDAMLVTAGPELAMHLATDARFRARVEAAARGQGPGPGARAVGDASARARLTRIASPRLRAAGGL